MKVEMVLLPFGQYEASAVRIRLSEEGWTKDLTVPEAKALMHGMLDALVEGADAEGSIDS